MATMRQIRSRIRVAGNIAQITGAMEMVAAAKLKKAQDRLEGSRPYVTAISETVTDLLRTMPPDHQEALATPRLPLTVGLVILTADRGLCGSYNSNVLRRASQAIEDFGRDRVRLMVIGRRGRSFFQARGFALRPLPVEESGALEYRDARAVMEALTSAFLSEELDEVYLVYTQFLSPLTQRPVLERLLPIAVNEYTGRAVPDYRTEPDRESLAAALLPRYLAAKIYHAMLESAASEHGSRMTSMSAATDNATNMISTLTLALNRARQAAITKEISEIVSGAEALKA